jgi:hypothetical protein
VTLQNLPEVTTRADVVNLMNAAGNISGAAGTGGITDWFELINKALQYANRFNDVANRFNDELDRAYETINRVKGLEAVDQTQQPLIDQGTFIMPPGNDYQMPIDSPEQVMPPPDRPQPPPPTEPRGEPVKIPAKEVYKLALNGLTQLPEDMTVGKALEMARDNKALILPMIEQQIDKLIAEHARPNE